MGRKIPTLLNNFNTYAGGKKYIGVSSETTLPTFESLTETLEGAGIAGDIEEAVVGCFSSLESETSFQNIGKEYFNFLRQTDTVTYRGSMQILDMETQTNDFQNVTVVTKGRVKSFELGTLKRGGKGEAKIVRELTYVKVIIDGETMLELDKFNMIYKLDGVDLLQKVRSQI